MFNFWWLAGLVNKLEPHPLPLSSQKMKCSFLDYFQFLVISQAGRWTQTPSSTPLQPKNEMLIFGLCSTSDDQPGWPKDCNPICHPSPTKKMKCSFLDYAQLLMIGRAGQWTRTPSAIPLQTKKWYAHFSVTFKFWSLARLVNGLEPHLQPLSRHKMKYSFLHYVQLVMIGWAGQWTQTPSATPLQPKKWNANFWITFNLWWSAGLVDGLEPHLPPLSNQKKWNAHFWIMFNFWWSAGLVDELESHLPPLSSHKIEVLIFGLGSTSDDWPGWSMDSNPIHHLSPAKEWNAHFWITFNFWWSAGLVDGLEPHLPPLSNQKNEMLAFVLRYSSDHQPGW